MIRLLLLVFLIPTIAFSQSACDCAARNFALVRFHKEKGQHQEAYTAMLRGLSFKDTSDWDGGNYLELAEIEQSLGKSKDAKAHLLKAIELDGNHEYVRKYSSLKEYLTPDFLPQFEAALARKQSRINLDYYSTLYQILGADQIWRNHVDAFDTVAAVYKMARTIDSIGFYTLRELVDSLGFPTAKRHGFTSFIPGIVIMHASVTSDTMYQHSLDLMDRAIARCELGKSFKAMIIDRQREWVEKKKQQFGVWSAASAVPELHDYTNVDSFRFACNLLSFGDQCEMYGQELPAAYRRKPYPKNYFCESKK